MELTIKLDEVIKRYPRFTTKDWYAFCDYLACEMNDYLAEYEEEQ